MRKIYLLLLLVSGFAFGQINLTGTANYKINIDGRIEDASKDGCSNGGLGYLKLTMVSGEIILKPDDNNFWEFQDFNFEKTFTKANMVTGLSLYTRRRSRPRTGCKITEERTADVPIQRCQNINYVDDSSNSGLYANSVTGNINVKTVSEVKILNSATPYYLGDEETLNISLPDNLISRDYVWMYKVGSGADTPIPAPYNRRNILNIQGAEFLTSLDYGKSVSIWLKTSCNSSNTLVFTYFKNAPKVVSTPIPTNVSCYDLDSKDGSVKLQFNKLVLPGERLNYTLIDRNTGMPIERNGTVVMASDKSTIINNLSRGDYEFQLIGFYDGFNTKVPIEVKTYFSIGSPTPVDFKFSKTDVRCKGGTDGTITINASGGTKNGYEYSIDNGVWVPFKNAASTTETINGLHPLLSTDLFIVYNIRVRDANDCIAKIQTEVNGKIELGVELSTPIRINQPPSAISLTNDPIFKTPPTFHGAKNGTITVSFMGGTPIAGNSYSFEWVNGNYTTAALASKTTTEYSNGIYAITLNGVPAGTYNLTVKDANGCTLNPVSQPKLAIVLNEPDPIKIELAITKPISCNTANFDAITGSTLKLADGTITATVKGGIPLSVNDNHGLLYYYTWSKLINRATDQWEVLTDIKGETATLLSKGTYSLNVTDSKGITQGIYTTSGLTLAVPTEITLAEPDPLGLTFTPTPVSCYNGNNGSAIANVTGGTGGYFYKWSTTATTQKIIGLDANDGNKYKVTITDSKGCTISDGILITQPPSPVSLKYITTDNPKFSGATNGKIVVEVTGGTPIGNNSYGYLWKNSKGDAKTASSVYDVVSKIFTLTLDDLPADKYSLTVWDKNYNAAMPAQIVNCSIIDSEITLEQPKPLVVTFEVKQTISCNASNEFGNEKDAEPTDGKRDESQDGILVAHVTGGIKLLTKENNSLPYFFYWKKQQTDGSWVAWDDHDETAEHLSHGNYALNIKDGNGIVLGTYGVNNELITAKDSIHFMKEPDLFDVNIAKGDVYCKEGNDGWATATVVGGTAPYQYDWSNGETIPENTILKAGDYSIVINDDKKCITKDKVTILEPIAPITLKYIDVINPSFYKATNGRIVVEVKGGTPFADKSYGYEWKNSAGKLQTVSSQVINGVYTLTLNGLPEDIYTLTIRDKNYDAATNKIGCTIVNSTQTLDDPDPIVVIFEVKRTISCNVSNKFGNEIDTTPKDGQRDESQDGILVAHVTGGIQLAADQNSGLPYFYTWKKQLANKSWVSWNDHDETAENLSDGIYALNIEDKNGIKLGTYVNNLLTTEIDVTQAMPEPPKLEVTFTKFDVGCTVGNDGWAKANVSGGTPPYTYQWTNEATTDKIENLTTNNYFVIITDAKGCSVQGSVFVGDPKGIIATETTRNPTCFQGNDGAINLDVIGGNLPYSYKWNTDATTKDIKQLKAGNYEVAITCPDCCVYKKYFTLKDPAPIVVNLGPDRTLCNAQSLDLDATILDAKAEYVWTATNGFTANTPKVNLTKAGIYHVKVTSGLGCIGEDDIEIKNNNVDINSEFFLSSQAYLDEEVILVNASNPFGENTQWIIPENVNIVEQKEKFITLKFNKIGVYAIALKQTQGDCYALYSKNISVEPRSTLPNSTTTKTHFINDFIVTPNPSDGNFKALVNLESNSPVNLRLFSYSGKYTLIQKKDSGKKNYAVDFNVKLASGVYVLVLETAQQTLVKKIIIY